MRLGQRYDKTNKHINDISTNSEHYAKLKDEAKSHKAKNIHKVCQDLDLFHGKAEEIFKKVDESRTIDLPALWSQLTQQQMEKFVEYTQEWHPEDLPNLGQHTSGDPIEFEWVEQAFDRWCPDNDILRMYRDLEGLPERVKQIPDERKIRRDLENESEPDISVDTKVFQIAEPSVYRSFRIDEFPYKWHKMSNTKKIVQIWDLVPEQRLRFIYSLMYKRLSKVLKELEPRNVEHFNNSTLKQKYINHRKGKVYENFSVIATTVHGALIHKQALSKVCISNLHLKKSKMFKNRSFKIVLISRKQ